MQKLLYCLREAKQRRYAGAFEVRLLRDAHRAVLAAYELDLPDCQVYYAEFRKLAEELGYARVDVGYIRDRREGPP